MLSFRRYTIIKLHPPSSYPLPITKYLTVTSRFSSPKSKCWFSSYEFTQLYDKVESTLRIPNTIIRRSLKLCQNCRHYNFEPFTNVWCETILIQTSSKLWIGIKLFYKCPPTLDETTLKPLFVDSNNLSKRASPKVR
ncbi:hypothetical protein D3C76_1261840 [compost metagenome]